jgi:hypothetical protein
MGLLLITILGSEVRLLILDRRPINKYSVLTRFRLYLLAKSHALTFAKSLFIFDSISNNDLPHAVIPSRGVPINNTNEYTYLGYTLDNSLTLKRCFDKAYKTCCNRLKLLSKLRYISLWFSQLLRTLGFWNFSSRRPSRTGFNQLNFARKTSLLMTNMVKCLLLSRYYINSRVVL